MTTRSPHWAGQPLSTWVRRLAWSPDGAWLAGGGDDGQLYVWDGSDGILLQRLEGHHGAVTNVAWSPDGKRLVSAGRSRGSGELVVWDVQRGVPLTAEPAIAASPTQDRTANAQEPAQGSPGQSSAAQPFVDPLSQRELEVMKLLAAGASNQEIATALVLAPGTVKLHVSHILSKFGVKSRTQAILRARDLGLLPKE
jgi:DNA-binding CsgD family transcriptional regulator